MPVRHCMERGCTARPVYMGRCAAHNRMEQRRRPRFGRAVYHSKRWRILRRRKLDADPICQHCDDTLATTVHHKVGLEQGGDPWAWDNLESVCTSCHTTEEMRRRRIASVPQRC